MLFRDTSLGANHGRLVSEWVDGASSRGQLTPLRCERVHFASGRGVCLTAERGFTTTYGAAVFDSEFRILSQFPLAGVPSRVRVSPDGHRAAITVFVSGDSYAPGSFSTRTTVLDTLTGESLFDLEQMHVERDGAPFKAIDFNFWGVTFESAARFYATLATGGRIYLVVGNVDTRQATVMRETVECPSLSPDGTRVAFKKRTQSGGRLAWRIHVMDLVTGAETPLGETRSVDDQVEWVDAARVAYGLPSESRPESTDVWTVPADGTGAPSLLRAGAWSPVVVRQAAVFEP
jgi:hypothetical protein